MSVANHNYPTSTKSMSNGARHSQGSLRFTQALNSRSTSMARLCFKKATTANTLVDISVRSRQQFHPQYATKITTNSGFPQFLCYDPPHLYTISHGVMECHGPYQHSEPKATLHMKMCHNHPKDKPQKSKSLAPGRILTRIACAYRKSK